MIRTTNGIDPDGPVTISNCNGYALGRASDGIEVSNNSQPAISSSSDAALFNQIFNSTFEQRGRE